MTTSALRRVVDATAAWRRTYGDAIGASPAAVLARAIDDFRAARGTVDAEHVRDPAPLVRRRQPPFRRLVVIESPYAGDVDANTAYARACVADSIARGEAPIASHLLLTQPGILRDDVPAERRRGIGAGHAWIDVADVVALYVDRGMSRGMEEAVGYAAAAGVRVERRTLPVRPAECPIGPVSSPLPK